MAMPELTVVAQGALPTGERWAVRAGGTTRDYYTFLGTVHPDGHRDKGGMGGPPLRPGRVVNCSTGRGLLRVLARTAPQVRRIRLELGSGEVRELAPAGADPARGLTFFAALLRPAQTLTALLPLDAEGQVIDP